MGREVRKVPQEWKHPKDYKGNYVPLMGGSFSESANNWDRDAAMWRLGFKPFYGVEYNKIVRRDGTVVEQPKGICAYSPMGSDDDRTQDPSDYFGQRPLRSDYMPDWPDAERTHWQMYEDTSEGTPISPVCSSPEILARWLADNQAISFGNSTAAYEQWLAMISRGYAPSMVMEVRANGAATMQSGVEAMGADDV